MCKWVGLLVICCMSISVAHASDLTKLWKQSLKGVFVAPSAQDFQQAKILFQRLFDGDEINPEAWSSLGMHVSILHDHKDVLIVVYEQENRQFGRGFFVVRKKMKDLPLLLQAPHTFKDLYTGRITLKLLLSGRAQAAAWNTVPRSYERSGILVDADMAHRSNTFFVAFGEAFAQRYPTAKTMQLHGFSQKKRRSDAGMTADFILSSGNQRPNVSTQHLSRCLKKNISTQVKMYPVEVSELGGTRNVTARLLRNWPSHHFIHMEMSFEIRQAIRESKKIQGALLSCL